MQIHTFLKGCGQAFVGVVADNDCQKPLTQQLTSYPHKGSSFGKKGACLHPGRNFASSTSSWVFVSSEGCILHHRLWTKWGCFEAKLGLELFWSRCGNAGEPHRGDMQSQDEEVQEREALGADEFLLLYWEKCTIAPRGWERACAALGSWV